MRFVQPQNTDMLPIGFGEGVRGVIVVGEQASEAHEEDEDEDGDERGGCDVFVVGSRQSEMLCASRAEMYVCRSIGTIADKACDTYTNAQLNDEECFGWVRCVYTM